MPKYRIDVRCRRKYFYARNITEVERVITFRPFYYLKVSVTECSSIVPDSIDLKDDDTNPFFE